MLTRLRAVAGAAVLALILTACAQHTHSIAALAAQAETGVHFEATLATLGSFEWDVAPLKTKAAQVIYQTAVAYKLGHITQEYGQSRVDAADHVHALLQQALAACAQDDHTGHCTKDEAQARALVDQAKATFDTIPPLPN